MKEDFLQFIWKYKRFQNLNLKTTRGNDISIINFGQVNFNSGPDIFNAKIQIGDQIWAGNVEFHIKSSDWYVHKHDIDLAYENVILHVVWHFNTEITRKDGTTIDTLELSKFVDPNLVENYHELINSKTWINCEKDFSKIDNFIFHNWIERLYVERLEQKSEPISLMLGRFNNDWEQILFIMLFRSFGLKVNGDAFESIAKSIDYNVVRKTRYSALDLEALFFGQAKLLEKEISDPYYLELKGRYDYLKHKFKLNTTGIISVKYFRLRPSNFPTIRLAQLAGLYFSTDKLFSKVINLDKVEDIYNLFRFETSQFWTTHYNFSNTSIIKSTYLSKSFINLIIINAIIPLKYMYLKSLGKFNEEILFNMIEKIPLENNRIIRSFQKLKPLPKNSLISQGLLQLKTNYCDKNNCMSCAIGNSLLH